MKLKLIINLFLFLFITVSIGYSVGTTYCVQLDSNGKLSSNSEGTKFNPGHYVSITEGMRFQEQDKRMQRIQKFINDPEITGMEVYFEWSELEPTQENYNFAPIQDILDLFVQHDKHMILYIVDRSFWNGSLSGQTCGDGIDMVPKYLKDRGGTYIDSRDACMPKMYESWFVDHYINFLNAIGDEFNEHPNFEMVLLGETALAFPKGGNYNQIEYGRQLERFYDETDQSFKNTMIGMQINYLHEGRDQTMDDLFDAIVRNGGSLSWPDPFPGRNKNELLKSHKFARDNPNLVPVTPHADTTHLYFDDTREVFDRYVNELGATHVLWHDIYTGRPDGGYIPRYYEDQIIPTLRENNARTNTVCPSTLGTCLDTSQVCNGDSNPVGSEDYDCAQINPGENIAEQYGAPYDFDNNRKTMKATCSESNNANAEIGYSGSNYYIYQYGYLWKNNEWQQIELQGTKVSGSDAWIRDIANTQVNDIDPNNENYYLSYVCKWDGSRWKCGCHDASCLNNYWNLQIIAK